MVGPPFDFIGVWRSLIAAQGVTLMDTQEIIVLAIAVVLFGGLGLLSLYMNRPEKKDRSGQDSK